MINFRSFPLCVLAGFVFSSVVSLAQHPAPSARIVRPIDENQLVTLSGNTHPAANAKNDRGAVRSDLPMTDLILVLSRSPEQQAAFDAFVASQSDPSSPNYHQWLTPDQVGEQFGPSLTDVATISTWLTSHGLAVAQVSRDRMSIRFNGTAGVVNSTFHTEIHNLVVNGVPHIGNMSDPQIPAALASVVVGVKQLHNFFPRPLHHMGQLVQHDLKTGGWVRQASTAAIAPRILGSASSTQLAKPDGTARPQFGISVGGTSPYLVEDVGAWDFATIYNVAPLWNAGIDGTGQTIAIAGTSAIDIGESSTAVVGANGNNDVATFRTFFNLPTNNSRNTPIQISGNSQPLQVCTSTLSNALCGLGDLEENSLDVEWSGAVAKNAQIVLVASYPASPSDDNLYDSESYIVDNVGNSSSPVFGAHVMNVSYGECELGLGTAGNVQYYNLWQTAAAEGIAVFVATGDSGSASCDQGGDATYGVPYPAEYGLTVSGLATTPFNTAVGGTDFNWCPLTSNDACATEASTYWNTANSSTTESNAKGYIPELPWNDTCTSPLALPFMKSFFSGVTYLGSNNQTFSVTDAETGCNALYYYDSTLEQDGDGLLLDLVDTVGGGGGASSCIVSSTNPTGTTVGTCTTGSTTTGTSNGSITLSNNGWPSPSWQAQSGVTGTSGLTARAIPDVSFFASDGFLSSSAYLICVSAASQDPECTYSTSSEPFAQEVGGTSVATPAMAGVMALINQKAGAAQGSPNAELYSLAAKQSSGSCSAESTHTSNGCYFNDIDQGTNAMACDYSAYVNTPSPNCTIAHAGDYVGILPGYSAGAGYDQATGLGSLNIANVVNGWTATTGLATPTVTVTPQNSTINSSNSLNVTVSVTGSASTPTGTITLSGGGYAATTETIGTSPCASASNCVFTIPGNTLTAGTVTLTASYSGDTDYAKASSTAQVTVTQATLLTPTITVTPASQTLNSEGPFTVTVSVSGSGATPTGTVTLSSGSYSSGPQTLVNSSYKFTIGAANQQTPLAAGTDTLTATYSGDSNYATGTNTAQVTVTESTFKLTAGAPSSSSVTPGQSATVTVTVAATAGYTGSVSLTCQQTSTTASGGDGTTCTGGGGGTAVTLTSSSASGTVTFTIGTAAPVTAELARPKMPGKGWLGAGSGAVLALLIFFGIPARRRSWRSMLGVLIAFAALGVLSSCGGGNSGGGGGGGQNDPGTTAGAYTYTVTATPTPSVSPTVTTTFTVTVN
jgi:subtilase family serine protease